MKYIFTLFLLFSMLQISTANDSISTIPNSIINQKYNNEIEELKDEISSYKKELLTETINSYQQTNDRLNNYLTFTGIMATIFGVIIAVGGIFIGFESIKSQRRREEAVKTLEEAKNYVENKKSEFIETVSNKLEELDKEYQKILTLSKERLLEDVNSETQKVKDIAMKKSQEIEDYSVDEKTDKRLESLQKRIQFFENIGIPDDPKILLSKAKILSEKEMHKEAIELLKKLIQIEEDNNDAHWQLGWENAKIDNHIESIKYYQRSIELKTNNSSAHNNLAIQFENTEKPLDALKEYEKAISLNPEKKLYHNNKIRVLKKLNSEPEVLKTYNDLLNIDKKDAEIYNDIINFLEGQKKFKEAIEYYDLAISEIEDKKQEFNYSKALALKKMENFNESINGFQNSIDNDYRTEHCYLNIADIKFQQNNKTEAIDILSSAIALNPKNANLYAVKAKYEIEDNDEEAFKTILSGAKQIEGEFYFQSMGKYLAEKGHIDFAIKLYVEANEIIKSKLSDNKEVDILNYYEGLIIIGEFEEAKQFISTNESNIVNDKYKIVKSFIDLCSQVIHTEIENPKDGAAKFEKYVNNDSFVKIDWSFNDLLFCIKEKIEDEKYQALSLIADLLKGKMNLENYRLKIK